MIKGQRQAKDTKAERGEPGSRQPAWRGQAPAHPRRRVRRKPMTVPASAKRPVGAEGGRAAGGRTFTMPSRESLLGMARIAALLLAAVVVTSGLIFLLRLPALTVGRESTQIGGNLRIGKEEIYTSSGIDGRNILLLRRDEIAARVREIPGVAKTAVHVRLPNQVIIDVREHAPLVAWHAVTETVWLAADGSPVPQAGAEPPLSFTDLSNGRLSKDETLRQLVLTNLTAVHEARPELAEFYYADEPGLYYRAPEGWDVWLGESGPMEDKLTLVEAAGREIARQGAQAKVVDVRQSERKALWR